VDSPFLPEKKDPPSSFGKETYNLSKFSDSAIAEETLYLSSPLFLYPARGPLSSLRKFLLQLTCFLTRRSPFSWKGQFRGGKERNSGVLARAGGRALKTCRDDRSLCMRGIVRAIPLSEITLFGPAGSSPFEPVYVSPLPIPGRNLYAFWFFFPPRRSPSPFWRGANLSFFREQPIQTLFSPPFRGPKVFPAMLTIDTL